MWHTKPTPNVVLLTTDFKYPCSFICIPFLETACLVTDLRILISVHPEKKKKLITPTEIQNRCWEDCNSMRNQFSALHFTTVVSPFVTTFHISSLILEDSSLVEVYYISCPMILGLCVFVFSKGRLVEVPLTANSKSSSVFRKGPSEVSEGVLQLF